MALTANYKNYVVAVKGESIPSSSYNAKSTTSTGFMEFKPRDMSTQKKYDAMSPEWQGVESSMQSVKRGDYSLDSAEKNRQELRGEQPPAKTWSDICVVQ